MFQVEFAPAPHVPDLAAKNLKINLARGLPPVPLQTPDGGYLKSGAIRVCGSGPSLRTKAPWGQNIAALNGAWLELAKLQGAPEYIIAYDPAPENVAWFENAPKGAKYFLGSRMDPRIFDILKDHEVYIWHLLADQERGLGLTPLVGGGHNVGTAALNLLAQMGYDHFDLYGYDSCWAADGAHHATPQEWAVEPPKTVQVGDRMFVSSPWMIGQVEQMMDQMLNNRVDYTVKVHDGGMLAAAIEENTLNVAYNLNVAPGSFDFVHSLFNVVNYMHENKHPQARVHFRAGSDHGFRPNDMIQMSHAGKQRMMNNVVRPLLEMFGMEEVAHPGPNPVEFEYSPAQSLSRYRATGYMPEFQASREARIWARNNYPDRPIVITLRECSYWPQRNSDVFEWVRFARHIGGSKRVIFVRDTDCVGQPFEFETCDEASLDLHKRAALYKRAGMCFFVMNGPATLAYYTQDVPYAVFITSAPGYKCYSPEFLQRFIGIDPFGQFPWANLKRQRLVYADDDFEIIKKTYEELAR